MLKKRNKENSSLKRKKENKNEKKEGMKHERKICERRKDRPMTKKSVG